MKSILVIPFVLFARPMTWLNDSPASMDCPSSTGPFRMEDSRITGSIAFDPSGEPLGRGDSLFVSGTAFHEDGLAIREVRIAGVAAARDEFNFARWSARACPTSRS